MYGSIYYDKKSSVIKWSEYDNKNIRTEHKQKWAPDFYIESQDESNYKSLDGRNLKRIVERTYSSRRDILKEYKECGLLIYGSDLSLENKFILERWPQDLTVIPNIRLMFVDIETECERGFSESELAEERINLITCWSSTDNIFHTFGLEHDFKSTIKDVIYVQCQDEEELLEQFISYVERYRHDIWSGWNSSNYDIPYLVNRILRLMDNVDVTTHKNLLHLTKEKSDKETKESIQHQIYEIEEKFFNIKRLSHFGVVEKSVKMSKDPFTKEMKPSMIYTIEGVTDYDYLKLDKQFGQHKRDSYKLDNVAFDEVGERKVEYDGTLKQLYTNDWKTFVEYNIQDVRLLVKMNMKLNYIPQAITLSYKCHCTFKDNFGTVQKAEAAAYNFLYKDNIILDDRRSQEEFDDENSEEDDKIPGGFVTHKDDLRRGKHKWVADFDVESLYPSLMRGLNVSYETKVAELKYNSDKNVFELDDGEEVYVVTDSDQKKFTAKQVVDYIKKNDFHVSSRKIVFKNSKTHRGVLVKMLDMWFAQRKADKKLSGEYRQKALDLFNKVEDTAGGVAISESKVVKHMTQEQAAEYNEYMRLFGVHYNLQWSCKILLNSIYGCLASKFSRFYGQELASSVTLSGQTVIKHNGNMLNDFFNNEFFDMPVVKKNFPVLNDNIKNVDVRLYQDTDSQIFSSVIRTNKGIFRIGDLYELYENKNKHLTQYGHEIVDVSKEGLECLTYNELTKKAELGQIKKLVRHKVTKKKWKIKVNGKEIIITEDHCAVVKRDGELLRIKPKDIIKGDKILTIF
jgi:DNA polymerase elongation subunit (family B)